MPGFAEYDRYDALGLAELVRTKQVSPSDLVEESITRIERLNPKINAVVTPLFDQARAAAKANLPDGPFTGVPFLMKDLLAALAGVRLSNGSKAFKNYVPDYDSELVKRWKASGVVILGKTNTPEFGLLGVTEPELFGPTRNPWDLEHTPGGSSGGSAAAIASGMVPMASGGDGGGSIRIPSCYCGLFGLKPTRGRTPIGPTHAEAWQGAAIEHVLTRSVRDCAAMLDATQGADPGAPYAITPPEQPYLSTMNQAPPKLKVAFTDKSPLGTDVHPECVKAVRDAAKLLEELGHSVEEAQPDIDGLRLANCYLNMYFGEIAADIAELETVLHRKAKPSDVEPLTWTLGVLGRAYSAGEFVLIKRYWNTAARNMARFFQTYDLYLTPTVAQPPARIGELVPKPAEMTLMKIVNTFNLGKLLRASGITDKLATESLSRTPFTQLVNLTGLPAMSVPLHWTPDGLPLGTHFIAPHGGETLLFQVAAQLEQARPWFDKRPHLKI